MPERAGPVSVSDPALPRVAAALRAAARRLAAVSDTARLDAEIMMAHALGTTRSGLLLQHMNDPVPAGFEALVVRREAHEPVAYITGVQEFYGRAFKVGRGVLIPRADSETIIVAALDAAFDRLAPGAGPDTEPVSSPLRVLDCGTGSGALLLTVLAELDRSLSDKGERPGSRHDQAGQGERIGAPAHGVGIDRSSAALAIARDNAARLGLSGRVRLIGRDWEQPGWAEDLGRFDLILANPPYVEDAAALPSPVREWEPAEALFAGSEGLDAYRVLIPQLPPLLAASGVVVLEIGATQAGAVARIAAEAGFLSVLHNDLGGRPRALVLRLGVGKRGANS